MEILGQGLTSFYSSSFPCWKTTTRKFRFNAAGCSLSKTIYSKRFSGVFRTKIWEQLSWSQTSQWDEISFTKPNFWGKNMHKFTHIHCWTANRWFSRPRQCPRLCVDDEAGMRSSVQVVRITSGCRHSSSSAVLKVPSSYSVLPQKKQAWCLLFLSATKVSHL